jgi:hypothetical protein
MQDEFSITTLALRVLAASAVAAVSYLFICAALRPSIFGVGSPIGHYENLFALAVTAIVFALVLWRLIRGSWGKDQVSKILDLDSDGY